MKLWITSADEVKRLVSSLRLAFGENAGLAAHTYLAKAKRQSERSMLRRVLRSLKH